MIAMRIHDQTVGKDVRMLVMRSIQVVSGLMRRVVSIVVEGIHIRGRWRSARIRRRIATLLIMGLVEVAGVRVIILGSRFEKISVRVVGIRGGRDPTWGRMVMFLGGERKV